MRQTHLKITLCMAHHLEVKEGLIPKEQQQPAAAPGKQEAASAA